MNGVLSFIRSGWLWSVAEAQARWYLRRLMYLSILALVQSFYNKFLMKVTWMIFNLVCFVFTQEWSFKSFTLLRLCKKSFSAEELLMAALRLLTYHDSLSRIDTNYSRRLCCVPSLGCKFLWKRGKRPHLFEVVLLYRCGWTTDYQS